MLCTCHFDGTNENPIPYFDSSKSLDDDLQVRIKAEKAFETEVQPGECNDTNEYIKEQRVPVLKTEQATSYYQL